MKNCILSFATCVAAIIFTSCSKEDTHQPDQPQKTTMEVSITAELDEFAPTTKATAEACIRLKWEGDETVYAYSALNDGTLSAPATLIASTPDNAYVAVLKGTITAPTDANKTLYLVYSGCGTPSISDHTVTVAMNGTQASDKVPFVAYAKLTGVTGDDHSTDGLQAKFCFASSVINVNVTGLSSGMSLSSASMSGLATNCTITFGGDIEVDKSGDETTYTKTLSGNATTSGKAQFFLAVPEMDASSSRTLTVTDGTNTYIDNGVVSGAHSANSYINTICCCQKVAVLLSGEFSVSATKQVQFTRGNLYRNGSAWGLEVNQTDYPTVWDTEHVGHLFWTKDAANSYAASYSDGECTTSDKFFADGSDADHSLTIEGQSGLYALSSAEWTYLLSSTDDGGRGDGDSKFKYGVTVNGAANCLVIAPDGYTGSIASSYDAAAWAAAEASGLVCLPAAGYRGGSSLYEGGSRGDYWSATPNGYDKLLAYDLYFNGSSVEPSDDDNFRNNGYSVRLVYSEATPVYPEAPELACVKIGDVWWAPVNCGYDATNAPTGLFYQWARQYGQSNTKTMTDADFITTQASSMADGNTETNKDKFYKTSMFDCWYSENKDTDTWLSTYDPCPDDWRIPTDTELTSLNSSSTWVEGKDITGKGTGSYNGRLFPGSGDSQIFLPVTGYRQYSGSIINASTSGGYWSSSPYTGFPEYATYMLFGTSDATMYGDHRAVGHSVRCVKE